MNELHVIYASAEEADGHVREAILAGVARSAILVSARAQARWSHKSEGVTLAVFKIDPEKARAAEAFIVEHHPSDEPEYVRGVIADANGTVAGAPDEDTE